MSAINVDDDPDRQPSRCNGDRNTEVERAVTGSGLPWVAVRPSSFAMNTLGMWRGQLTADIERLSQLTGYVVAMAKYGWAYYDRRAAALFA